MSNPQALAAMRYYRALINSRFHPCEARVLVHARMQQTNP